MLADNMTATTLAMKATATTLRLKLSAGIAPAAAVLALKAAGLLAQAVPLCCGWSA